MLELKICALPSITFYYDSFLDQVGVGNFKVSRACCVYCFLQSGHFRVELALPKELYVKYHLDKNSSKN